MWRTNGGLCKDQNTEYGTNCITKVVLSIKGKERSIEVRVAGIAR